MDRSPFPVLMGRQMIRQNIMATRRRTHRLRVITMCLNIVCIYHSHICIPMSVCVVWQWLGRFPASGLSVCERLKMWSLSFHLCALFPQLILLIIPSNPEDENTYIVSAVRGLLEDSRANNAYHVYFFLFFFVFLSCFSTQRDHQDASPQ